MPADLILYALIAAGLVFWLRSVLGTRHGDERQRPNPFSQPTAQEQAPRSAASPAPADARAAMTGETVANPLALPRNSNATIAPAAEQALMDIARADRGFTMAHFVGAAQDVFAMIVEAFATGDRDLLKSLLAPDLYKAFDQALTERAAAGHVMTAEIHAIRKVDISDAQFQGKMAYITVRFVADETVVTKDKDGTVLHGHPDRVRETIDIWTFGRSVGGKDPTWYLYATREEETSEIPSVDAKPV